MIIGFDWYNTITRHEGMFVAFSKILKASGHKIYVVTAAQKHLELQDYATKVKEHLDSIGFERDGICAFSWQEPKDIPGLKLEKCQGLKIEYFFDDRSDVCYVLEQHGIKACNVRK